MNSADRKPHPLKESLQQQLEREELSREQMAELMSLQRAVLEENPTLGWLKRHLLSSAVAAALLVFAILLMPWREDTNTVPDMARAIAMEVAQNHLKLKPLDVSTQSIGDIRAFFTQLDFSPVNSELAASHFTLLESEMLGGRYCSIQGVTAAQLRYRSNGDGLSTLYEVGYDPDVFGTFPHTERGEDSRVIMVNGLQVSIWVEKDLLMALVEEIGEK